MKRPADDPWTRWYDAYLVQRAVARVRRAQVRERQRAVSLMVCLLIGYMLVGGAVASVTVGLVMAN